MSLIDALAIVSCAVAVGLFFGALAVAIAGALLAPLMVAGFTFIERDWRAAARWAAWWVASLAALVLLIWIDGNVEPWWPR